jgi:hypothetical protein
MTHENSAHRRALEEIALHPDLFGISNVVSSIIEMNLLDKKGLIAQPDVVFYCSNREVYILEYKGNGNGEFLARAQEQLLKAAYWFGKYTDIESEKIHTRIITGEELSGKFPMRK